MKVFQYLRIFLFSVLMVSCSKEEDAPIISKWKATLYEFDKTDSHSVTFTINSKNELNGELKNWINFKYKLTGRVVEEKDLFFEVRDANNNLVGTMSCIFFRPNRVAGSYYFANGTRIFQGSFYGDKE